MKEYNEQKDILVGNFVDTYYNLLLKARTALDFFDTSCRSKVLILMDDDIIIKQPTVFNKSSREYDSQSDRIDTWSSFQVTLRKWLFVWIGFSSTKMCYERVNGKSLKNSTMFKNIQTFVMVLELLFLVKERIRVQLTSWNYHITRKSCAENFDSKFWNWAVPSWWCLH